MRPEMLVVAGPISSGKTGVLRERAELSGIDAFNVDDECDRGVAYGCVALSSKPRSQMKQRAGRWYLGRRKVVSMPPIKISGRYPDAASTAEAYGLKQEIVDAITKMFSVSQPASGQLRTYQHKKPTARLVGRGRLSRGIVRGSHAGATSRRSHFRAAEK